MAYSEERDQLSDRAPGHPRWLRARERTVEMQVKAERELGEVVLHHRADRVALRAARRLDRDEVDRLE